MDSSLESREIKLRENNLQDKVYEVEDKCKKIEKHKRKYIEVLKIEMKYKTDGFRRQSKRKSYQHSSTQD